MEPNEERRINVKDCMRCMYGFFIFRLFIVYEFSLFPSCFFFSSLQVLRVFSICLFWFGSLSLSHSVFFPFFFFNVFFCSLDTFCFSQLSSSVLVETKIPYQRRIGNTRSSLSQRQRFNVSVLIHFFSFRFLSFHVRCLLRRFLFLHFTWMLETSSLLLFSCCYIFFFVLHQFPKTFFFAS